MRRVIALAVVALTSASSNGARADEGPTVPRDFPRLVLDTGRLDVPPPDADAYRVLVRGEYQIRYQVQRSFPLVATASAIDRQPGLVEQSLKQNQFLTHWLRVTPRLQLRDKVEVVAQLDVLTGLVAGDKAVSTRADYTPRDEYNGFSNVQPRWLYAQWILPFGLIRVGQQPNHWGMGVLANDGDHPLLFGDYRYGSISERILFASRPGNKDFYLAIAGDLVYRDANARLTRGQHAFQGVIAAYYEKGFDRLGVFSTLRHQENDKTSNTPLYPYTDELDAFAFDVNGRIVRQVPGNGNAFLFAEAEAAFITGSTNFVRTADQLLANERTQLRSYGGAAMLGVVHRDFATGFWSDRADEASARAESTRYLGKGSAKGVPFGDIVAQLELGYASGDADPYDNTQRRFTFDPNHRIGLLLFDEVMRFQTARSSTAARDPLLTNANRPAPGVEQLPSNGGVFGAQYVNPTAIYRPRHWLDLKGGMVIAQATSDIIDPYRLAIGGSYVNYRGGSPRKKDLGVELDAGIEARIPLQNGLKAQLGAQGGVLFPGGAFEDTNGVRLKTQWLTVGRVGLLF